MLDCLGGWLGESSMQRNNPVPPLIQAWCELEQYVGQGVIWCVINCITYPESLFIGPKFALYSKNILMAMQITGQQIVGVWVTYVVYA